MLNDCHLTQKTYFKCFQLIHAIPKSWKLAVLNDNGNCKNIYLNHHLIKNYLILVIKNYVKRTIVSIYCSERWNSCVPKIFFQHFPQFTGWMEKRFVLSCTVSIDANLGTFRYKILTILYINKQLFIFNKKRY